MPFTNVFKLIGKVFRSTTKRPLQRFNIYNRSKNYIGEDSKHFFPAPRAIGPISKIGPSQYSHIEAGRGSFKSVRQRRLEAIESRNKNLLELSTRGDDEQPKSYSEIKQDDNLVIATTQKLPVIKTIQHLARPPDARPDENSNEIVTKINRPLPKSTNLDMQDPTSIWAVDKVPIGRLDLNKLQELMLNVLADEVYWTPKQIAENYNIKEEYAENLIRFLKQIRVVISPRMAKILDYTNRTNETYNATKHIIYIVDKSLRSDLDKSVDDTFLPEDELDINVRELLEAGQLEKRRKSAPISLKRPEPLKIDGQ